MHSRASHWVAVAVSIVLVVPSCHRATEDHPPTASVGKSAASVGISIRQLSPDAISDTAEAFDAQSQVAFVSAMVPWNQLESEDGIFRWEQLDADVDDARDRGHRIILRVMAGRLAPSWLVDEGMETVQMLGTDPNAFDYCEPTEVPVPWDPVLEDGYSGLLEGLASWMREPDGAGGTKADHILVVPIAMPSLLGTEMQTGFGSDVACPEGTRGAGHNLAGVNRLRWLQVASLSELRARTEAAWVRAIQLHMRILPAAVPSVIAYGGLFFDDLEAAQRIAEEQVPRYRGRLWSMFTNLQPAFDAQGEIAGPWSEWCPRCDQVLTSAADAGGPVAFQFAAGAPMDEEPELKAAVEDVLSRYRLRFIEVNEDIAVKFASYLLEGQGSVQARMQAAA